MDTQPPTASGRALAALRAAAELGDLPAAAHAAFEAALAGSTRADMDDAASAGKGRGLGRSPVDQRWMQDVAEALGGSLLAEEGERVRLLNTAAQLALGAGYDGDLVTALEHLTRSAVHHLDVAGLLRKAREQGTAWGRVDQQLVWAQRTGLGLLVFVQGGISRSSAPPPDEVAALRHELANAMTAIAGLAAQAQGDASDEAALRALARIRAVADAAVTDARRAGTVVSLAPRDVSRELSELVGDLAPFAAQRDVDVEARVEPGVRTRTGAGSLRLIVWNLLKNAIEASPNGASVVVCVMHREGNLRIVVEDRGTGLPSTLRDRVFEPHFSTKDQGRGLGLSLVQSEVQRLGGQVDVSAPERGGTRFTVVLPGALAGKPEDGLSASESSGVVRKNPLRGAHIALLCDFVFLEQALRAFGAEVTRTSVERLRAGDARMDVLVADAAELSLPEAASLRSQGHARRVVFLAAEGERPPAAGVDAVLERSFDMRELAETIEALVAVESSVG